MVVQTFIGFVYMMRERERERDILILNAPTTEFSLVPALPTDYIFILL